MRRPVVVATDFSPSALEALRYARRFARGAPLHLFHAFDWSDSKAAQAVATELERAGGERGAAIERLLRREAQAAEMGEGACVLAHGVASSPDTVATHAGRVAASVLAYAERVGAGAVAVGRHGRGSRLLPLPPRWLGSVALAVVRGGSTDALVVPPQKDAPWFALPTRRVVAAVDEQATAQALVARAEGVAEAAGAALDLLHVVGVQESAWNHLGDPEGPEGAERRLRAALASLVTPGARAGVHLRHGDPAGEIAAWVSEHGGDLVVMASHRPDAVDRVLVGSVAERVIARASCPVWVLRAAPEIQPPSAVAGGASEQGRR